MYTHTKTHIGGKALAFMIAIHQLPQVSAPPMGEPMCVCVCMCILLHDRCRFGAAVVGSVLYVFGGYNNTDFSAISDTVMTYNFATVRPLHLTGLGQDRRMCVCLCVCVCVCDGSLCHGEAVTSKSPAL